MATEAPTKRKKSDDAPSKRAAAEAEAAELLAAEGAIDPVLPDDKDIDNNKPADDEEALEILEPKAEPRRWIIGKPPEHGGTDDTYSIYVQKPMGYITRLRFFALITNTIAEGIKSSGTINFGMGDALEGGGTVRERINRLRETDFADSGSFMTLAMQLVGYSPGFLLECYCLWLDVPQDDKAWAKKVMAKRYDPEENSWGLSEDDGIEMIEVFVDQNYEDIRRFFVEKLPTIVRRAQQREKDRLARESESAQSKQSKR